MDCKGSNSILIQFRKNSQEWIIMIKKKLDCKGFIDFNSIQQKHSRVNHYDQRKLDYKVSIDFKSIQQKHSRVNHYDQEKRDCKGSTRFQLVGSYIIHWCTQSNNLSKEPMDVNIQRRGKHTWRYEAVADTRNHQGKELAS